MANENIPRAMLQFLWEEVSSRDVDVLRETTQWILQQLIKQTYLKKWGGKARTYAGAS